MRRDLGDFQTPPGLVVQVLDLLDRLSIPRARVIEPTCGRGNFLAALARRPDPPREMWGVETQESHLDAARAAIGRDDARLTLADLFRIDLSEDHRWGEPCSPLLVVGNPPWVTAAELGRLDSDNGPVREVRVGFDGTDARTGRSNFDLAEAVWVKLARELSAQAPTIALLCKLSVARNVMATAEREGWPVVAASYHRIDARVWFDASVEAGLFRATFGDGPPRREVDVYPSLLAERPTSRMGLVDGLAVADLDRFEAGARLFGVCDRTWRQGVKHDAAPVLELIRVDGFWRNGFGEAVDVEEERVYPLIKAADLAKGTAGAPERGLLVAQRSLSDDQATLEADAPRLWAYLRRHAERFAARRSSIYRRRSEFAIFGVGPYTFQPFKVAVSGLHRSAKFRKVAPRGGRPVVFDDTSYFLPCEDADEAEELADRLNGREVHGLLAALCFPGAKRPITKGLLQRIDLDRLRPSAIPLDARPGG